VQFFFDQSLENFLEAHVEAFSAFGGAPRVMLYDNLKAAVLARRGDDVQFNPRLLELAAHYHFAPRPCRPARGNEKGRVERAIQYIRSSFFAARPFTTLEDFNRQARIWCEGPGAVLAGCHSSRGERAQGPQALGTGSQCRVDPELRAGAGAV
jgi:transposase